MGPGTSDIGSMTFPPQMDIVDGHVQDAVAKGAKVLTGGHNLWKMAPVLGEALAEAAVGDGVREEMRVEARLGDGA